MLKIVMTLDVRFTCLCATEVCDTYCLMYWNIKIHVASLV